MKTVQDIRHFSSGIVEPYIFVSYSHDDSEAVEQLVQHLKEDGFCVWVDYDNIRGEYFHDDIKAGIRECVVFLQCLSRSYINKQYCEKEYKYADGCGKNFVVAAVDDVREDENPNAFPFYGNVYGFGTGIRDHLDEYWESIRNNVFLIKLKEDKEGETAPRYIFAGEQILTELSRNCDITYRHSGNYILNEIHGELFADILDEGSNKIYRAGGDREVSLYEFLKTNEDSSFVFVKGAGGTGKTVSMIQTCRKLLKEGICAVYIPLNKIRFQNSEDPIKKYIHKHIMGCDGSMFRSFESMANSSVKNNVYLFLDGVNELPVSAAESFEKYMETAAESSEWSGTRFVLASRTEMEINNVKSEILDMMPLEEEKIRSFLDKRSVEMPEDEKVLELIDNPLMLGLYADAEKYAEMYREKGGKFKIKLETCPDTAAKIISNFMQTQLFQMASVSNGNSNFILYHTLIDYVLPAVAFNMVTSEELVTEREIRRILKEVLDEKNQHFCWYADTVLEDLWWEYGMEDEYISRKDMKNIHDFAIKNYRFLYLNDRSDYEEEPAVEFLHQEFRDYFAGAYLANEIRMLEKKTKYISGGYNELGLGSAVFEKDILEYCAGILKEEKACPVLGDKGYIFPGKNEREPSVYSCTENVLHTVKRKTEETDPGIGLVISNLMEVLRKSRKDILAQCDFSELDLRKCHMNGCYFSEFYKDHIYTCKFDGAILDRSFLMNEGHIERVCAVAEGKDGWIYSADIGGNLLTWNYKNNKMIRIKKYQDIPKSLVYDRNTNRLCIALENQIILLECSEYTEIFTRFNENGSMYFRYIKFTEHGEVKFAYDLEPLRWFDLFTNKEEDDNLQMSVMSNCVLECREIHKIIYTLYGKNICIRRFDPETGRESELSSKKMKWIVKDIIELTRVSRINGIAVDTRQSRLAVAVGENIIEYVLSEDCDIEEMKPRWIYNGAANVNAVQYLSNGGFVLAAGKKIVILDGKGKQKNVLRKESVSDVVMFTPRCNGASTEERYYLMSREFGVLKELDEHLCVTRARRAMKSERFVWVKDRKSGETQMLFGPAEKYPNGYRFSFETGKIIPSGWCFEVKTTHYDIQKREYVTEQGEAVALYSINDEKEHYEYVNHMGVWIFGSSFYGIKGEMAESRFQLFLKKNGGMVDGV